MRAEAPEGASERAVPAWAQRLPRPAAPLVASVRPPVRPTAPSPDALAAMAASRLAAPEAARIGVATAVVPVLAEHTRYVDGFALHLALVDAVAVAVQPAPPADAPDSVPDLHGDADLAAAVRAVAAVLGAGSVSAAVETSVPPGLVDTRVLGAAAAAVRALAPDLAEGDAQSAVVDAAMQVLGVPVSRSDAAAALVARPGHVVLSDAASGETLPLDLPAELVWGLVPTGEVRSAVRIAALARRAERARAHVAAMHRPVASLREIEHEELAGLLATVDARHRTALAYLVGEDRRVQRFVAALRRSDAQMMGAILALSAHARDDWARLTDAERAALDVLDARTGEGVFGATDVGHVRALLVLARPAALGSALAAATDALGLATDAAHVV